MRARHRHLNPGNAGASGAYDARFGFSVADGTAISTWEDRTSNNNDASQATAANQPTYETNEVNGQPAIKFDGSNDWLTFARFDSTEAWTMAVVYRTTGSAAFQGVILVRQSSTNFDRLTFFINNNTDYGPLLVGSNINGTNTGKGGSLRAGEWRVVFAEWVGGGTSGSTFYRAYDDGTEITLNNTGVGAINANLDSSIGCTTTTSSYVNFWNGFMASVAFGFVRPNASLRKRLTHAAGYSFKLACS
jgi:hypothetical protein